MPVVECSYCQSEITKSPGRIKKSKNFFCNSTCKGSWMSNQKGKNTPRWKGENNAICYTCKKPYKERPSKIARNKKTFCSNKCYKNALPQIAHERSNSINARKSKPKVRVICEQCGKELWWHPSRLKQAYKHKFCSYDCRSAWRTENTSGKNSWAWKGGYRSYYGPNWNQQRKKARLRDKNTCQHCGITSLEINRELDVHHIKPFNSFSYLPGVNDNYKKANRLDNLISLCPSCHGKVEDNIIRQLALLNIKASEIKTQITRNRLEKKCARCQIIKPLDMFHKDKTRPDGHYSYCKSCVKEYGLKC